MSMSGAKAPKKLKIAYIAKSVLPAGGMERYAFELVCAMRDRGHDVTVLTREYDETRLSGVKFIPLPKRWTFSSVASAVALARDAQKELRGRPFDIVHSHERTYSQDILTFHCFSYRGSLEKYQGLRRFDQQFLSLRSWFYLWLEKRQVQTAQIIAVSDSVRHDLNKYYPGSKISVIPPGVDLEKYSVDDGVGKRQKTRNELGVKDEDLVMLFVGSEFKRKGLERIFPLVKKGRKLVVVGRGDHLSHYRELVRRQGIESNVTFTGLVKDARAFYAAADCLLLPSHSEAFGMSGLEAMACGLPVVVSNNCGIAAIIKDGTDGFIWQDDQMEAMLHDLQNKDYRKTIGRAARKKALQLTWNHCADQYEDIYFSMFECKKRSG